MKRCFLLFTLQQPLVSMGLEERCPREALLLVVKVVQVVFPYKQVVWPSISPPAAATPPALYHHSTSRR